MFRLSLAVSALAAMAACTSSIPNDVSEGVGFQTYQNYQARRAALRGETPPPHVHIQRNAQMVGTAPVITRPAPDTVADAGTAAAPDVAADPVIASAAAAIDAAETAGTTPTHIALASAPVAPGDTAISDEQDFDAVAARETIESDAERLARMQEQRVEVAPTALPDRPGSIGPNIIEYALATTHGIGERQHSRNPFGRGRHEANCRAFRSADLAQEWFLANGGPRRDRRVLDPDGDGFACGWDPELYRAAAIAARN